MAKAKAKVEMGGGTGQVDVTCPTCGEGRVPILPRGFLAGAAFPCSLCGSELSLAPESRDVYKDGLEKLETIETSYRDRSYDNRSGNR